MKKAFLIAAGTVTGLGAILSITPPAFSDAVSAPGLSGGTTTATKSATPTQPAAATPAQPAASTGFSGTVNGASYSARNYGTVSVSATFSNGKITSVSASQSPRSWSQQSLSVLLPYVNGGSITVEQVKQYSAAQLPCSKSNSCNSRASYTAEAFWSSLKSAITKAGL
jgi:uncharacterized protein with FMN-binding domain